MAMSNAEKLPQEIIFNILTRLSAKCISQFRCVSKQWCSLLSGSQFIKCHLKFYTQKKEEKLFFSPIHPQPHNGTTDAISRKLNFPQISDYWTGVVGSCNGLVLMINWEEVKYLINPRKVKYMDKYHRIPVFDLALRGCCYISVYSLGYDFAIDDYKVVAISRYQGPSYSTFVDVYSVRTGMWSRLESLPHAISISDNGALVNGDLYWLAMKSSGDSSIIVAFDLSAEKFSEVSAPASIDKDDVELYNLTVVRGCFYMFTRHENDEVDVWMMREYRVEESRTKFRFTVPNSVSAPLCFMSDDDVVLVVGLNKLIVYNVKENQGRDVIVDGVTTLHGLITFIESLVSPTFDTGTE
ncbi:f-boxkelch-repeat protein, partial [Nicotiana attenuata]